MSDLSLTRKVLLWFVVLLVITPLANGEEQPDKFKVGFILSMTGSWAQFGEAQKNALEMAREDRPELFTKVELIYEDCQYGAKHAVTAFNKLKDIDKVDAMFVWGVEPSLAVAPLAESHRMPLFVSALDPRAAIGREYVIRTINYAEQHSKKMMGHLKAKDFKKLAIVKTELSFFNVLVKGLEKNLSEDQSLEIVDNYLPHQADFRTTVSKLKRGSFDAVGIYLAPNQVAQFFRQFDAQKVALPAFGATPFQSRTVIRDAKGAMDGALFAHNFVDEKFRTRYSERVGDDQQIPWAANAYDFAIFVGEVLHQPGSKNTPQEIIHKATNFTRRTGVGGTYTFVDSKKLGRFFEYPVAVYKISGDDYSVSTH